MKNFNRMLGGIFLICGTTIGAGMLAMPISTGFGGFFPSMLLIILIWATMLLTAFFFLDVNLHIKGEPNLISMSRRMLGDWGKMGTWFFYLLLLYSLLAAYIAGSTSILADGIEALTGYHMPDWLAPFSLPVVFGGFIYLGTLGVDYINRVFIFGFALSYVYLVGAVPSCGINQSLSHSNYPALLVGVSVVTTSFGYHIIIPSLTTYMEHNAKMLRWTIIIGSAIPLLIYLAWQYIVLSTLSLGDIKAAWIAGDPATIPLASVLQSPILSTIAKFFSFFAIVTSFLGVSLSLSDFLIDGFKIKKSWEGKLLAIGLTFIPPLIFVYTYKRGFYLALQYAGAFVAILLIMLPALMAWRLKSKFYRSTLGRCMMIFAILIAVALITVNIVEARGGLVSLTAKY